MKEHLQKYVKTNSVAGVLLCFILAVYGCAAQTAQKQEASRPIDPGGDFRKLCYLLTPKAHSASDDLIRQWRKDVHEITTFTVEDHITVIESLQKEHVKLYEKYNHCAEQLTTAGQNYSSQWLTDLKNKYGLDYLKKNKEAVIMCLAALATPPMDHYCCTPQEKLATNEAALKVAYRGFCDLFNRFYDNLQNDQKSLLANQHKQVARLLESACSNPGIAVDYYTVRSKLIEQRAMRLNKELYLYMKNDLNILTVNLFKAVDDLKRLIGE